MKNSKASKNLLINSGPEIAARRPLRRAAEFRPLSSLPNELAEIGVLSASRNAEAKVRRASFARSSTRWALIALIPFNNLGLLIDKLRFHWNHSFGRTRQRTLSNWFQFKERSLLSEPSWKTRPPHKTRLSVHLRLSLFGQTASEACSGTFTGLSLGRSGHHSPDEKSLLKDRRSPESLLSKLGIRKFSAKNVILLLKDAWWSSKQVWRSAESVKSITLIKSNNLVFIYFLFISFLALLVYWVIDFETLQKHSASGVCRPSAHGKPGDRTKFEKNRFTLLNEKFCCKTFLPIGIPESGN